MGFKGPEKTRNEPQVRFRDLSTLPETTSNFRTWKVTETKKEGNLVFQASRISGANMLVLGRVRGHDRPRLMGVAS